MTLVKAEFRRLRNSVLAKFSIRRTTVRVDLIYDGPAESRQRLLLAHGAGAPMDSPFMNAMAAGVASAGIRVARFEFPYMAHRRSHGARRGGPNPAPRLLQCFREAIAAFSGPADLFIGGKSLGGRMASMVADEAGVTGLICLGYPFHPPGRPEQLRTAHLKHLRTPALILQGSRDSFGTAEELPSYGLPSTIEVVLLEDGDHSFKPRARSCRTETQAHAEAIANMVAFIRRTAPAT